MLTGYALAGDGKKLVTMPSLADVGDMTMADLSDRIDAIAYRPFTGELLGFSKDGTIYTIDPISGAMVNQEAKFDDGAVIDGVAVAFDFNNKIDAVRAVGSDGANLVYFPSNFDDEKANTVKQFANIAYADGDVNFGTKPMIFANAYTNAISGQKASATFQYALDASSNSLVSLANNEGTLATIGKLKIDGVVADLATAGGFDIVTPEEGADLAFAILQLDGAETSGLYSINLESAEATLVADLGVIGYTGFAVTLGDK